MAEWAGIAITAVLTIVGLYFANSLRLRTRADVERGVAEKRSTAYAALWAHTKVASPTRASPLTEGERACLYRTLTDWYYDDGNGMLLTEQTRNIYLNAKRNLTCPDDKLVPETLAQHVLASQADRETLRGQASIDQLSLLLDARRHTNLYRAIQGSSKPRGRHLPQELQDRPDTAAMARRSRARLHAPRRLVRADRTRIARQARRAPVRLSACVRA